MPPPIETYYSGSPEEQQDLLELRKDYYRTLRVLERRAATYGDAGVPAQVATAIADAKANGTLPADPMDGDTTAATEA